MRMKQLRHDWIVDNIYGRSEQQERKRKGFKIRVNTCLTL